MDMSEVNQKLEQIASGMTKDQWKATYNFFSPMIAGVVPKKMDMVRVTNR